MISLLRCNQFNHCLAHHFKISFQFKLPQSESIITLSAERQLLRQLIGQKNKPNSKTETTLVGVRADRLRKVN